MSPRCLGASWLVRASEHAPLRLVRERRPDLLAGDDVLVAVADRARLQRREVGARLRLGEALAPDLVGRQDRREEALLLLLGAVGDDGRAAHRRGPSTFAICGARARAISSKKIACSIERRAGAAVLGRPGQAGPAAVVELASATRAGTRTPPRRRPARGRGGCSRSSRERSRGTPRSAGDSVRSMRLRTLSAPGVTGAPGCERDAAEDQHEAADRRDRDRLVEEDRAVEQRDARREVADERGAARADLGDQLVEDDERERGADDAERDQGGDRAEAGRLGRASWRSPAAASTATRRDARRTTSASRPGVRSGP